MPNAEPQKGDRWIIFAQIAFGSALVMLGGFLAAYADGADAVATAIIAVGAAIIPPGAASAASTRIIAHAPGDARRRHRDGPPSAGRADGPRPAGPAGSARACTPRAGLGSAESSSGLAPGQPFCSGAVLLPGAGRASRTACGCRLLVSPRSSLIPRMEPAAQEAPRPAGMAPMSVILAGCMLIAGLIIFLWFAAEPYTYNIYKALHVVAILVWVGGDVTLTTLGIVFERRRDGAALGELGKMGGWIGTRVYTPDAVRRLRARRRADRERATGAGVTSGSTSRSSAGASRRRSESCSSAPSSSGSAGTRRRSGPTLPRSGAGSSACSRSSGSTRPC